MPRGEIATWVEGWVSASKALTQWDVLADYARATDNLPLAMDCLWRLHDWEMLQGMLAQNQGQVWIMLEGSRRGGGDVVAVCTCFVCVRKEELCVLQMRVGQAQQARCHVRVCCIDICTHFLPPLPCVWSHTQPPSLLALFPLPLPALLTDHANPLPACLSADGACC